MHALFTLGSSFIVLCYGKSFIWILEYSAHFRVLQERWGLFWGYSHEKLKGQTNQNKYLVGKHIIKMLKSKMDLQGRK